MAVKKHRAPLFALGVHFNESKRHDVYTQTTDICAQPFHVTRISCKYLIDMV